MVRSTVGVAATMYASNWGPDIRALHNARLVVRIGRRNVRSGNSKPAEEMSIVALELLCASCMTGELP